MEVIQVSRARKEQMEQIFCIKCFRCICWTLQIIIWVSALIVATTLYIVLIVLPMNVYFFYYILEISGFSAIFGCCSSKYDLPYTTVYEKMKQILQLPPKITWNITWYHFENQIQKSNTKKGENEQITKKKVITHRASKVMQFYS